MLFRFYIIVFLFLNFLHIHAQESGLILSEKIKKEKIHFQFIKNLVIVPVTFNNQPMNFIIDSGLKETILFSQFDQTIDKKDIQTITLKGLGKDAKDTKGFYSKNNKLAVGNHYLATNANIIIIQDENFNLFSRLGIDVHGIIGSEFFKNHPIEIDYAKQKITIYATIKEVKKLKKYQSKALEISTENKPFTSIDFFYEREFTDQKMLIDIGNSDGLWLFKNEIKNLAPLNHAFDDELGKGFNGIINGERGTITSVNLGKYKLHYPLIAVPDYESIQYINLKNNRKGSLGNEVLRRFSIILDYRNKTFYYKSNRNFRDAFHYNRSGLTIIHDEFEWKNEKVNVDFQQRSASETNTFSPQKVNYQIVMKPVYKIESVRKNSNADLIGLKANDILEKLNGKQVNKMSLDDIELFMKQNEFQKVSVEILRNNQSLVYKFVLEIPY
ncbi:aspartyl protease family protein [Empedobacter falsenii]